MTMPTNRWKAAQDQAKALDQSGLYLAGHAARALAGECAFADCLQELQWGAFNRAGEERLSQYALYAVAMSRAYTAAILGIAGNAGADAANALSLANRRAAAATEEINFALATDTALEGGFRLGDAYALVAGAYDVELAVPGALSEKAGAAGAALAALATLLRPDPASAAEGDAAAQRLPDLIEAAQEAVAADAELSRAALIYCAEFRETEAAWASRLAGAAWTGRLSRTAQDADVRLSNLAAFAELSAGI